MPLYNKTINRIKAVDDEDKKIGSEFMDKVMESLNSTWNFLNDETKNNVIEATRMLGDSYKEARKFKNPVNPLNLPHNVGATGARVIEGIGYASDKTIGEGVRFLGDKGNIDPRLTEIGAIAAQIYGTPKVIKGATNLVNKGIASPQAHSFMYKAGQTADEALGSFKPASQRTITLKEYSAILDDINSIPSEEFAKIVRLAKQPGINSMTLARRFNQQQGIISEYLKKFDKPPADFTGMEDESKPLLGDDNVQLNLWGKSTRPKTTAISLFTKRMQEAGFRKNKNENYFIDEAKFKNLTDQQQRDYAQLFQTDLNQAVPHLFKKTTELEVPKFNKKYEAYLNRYGGKPEVHHIFPSKLSMRFWFNEEYMGKNWYRLKEVADEYKQFPGEPSIEGEPINLTTLPSVIKKTDPNYKAVIERFGRIPPHIHNIVHNEILTNLIGQRGGKFFTKETLAKMNSGIDGKVEVFRDWNEVIKLTSEMVDEAMTQLDILFSNRALSENPEKLTSMLEEYLGTGNIKIGSSIIKDRKGNIIMENDRPKIATYSQFTVKDIVSRSFSDFTDDLLGKPRWKEVELEVKKFKHLNEDEILNVANILYQIKHYNGLKMWYGTRKAGEIVFGQGRNVKYYNELIDLYMDVVDDVLPNDTPTITTIEQLKSTTFKDFVKPSITEQLNIVFPDTQLKIPSIND
tara:strand:- start:193 stop:2253 length:2061 start_codon:yes stop_codon:yes gene_type:complete